MKRYICTSRLGNELELVFDSRSLLVAFALRGDFTPEQHRYVMNHVPTSCIGEWRKLLPEGMAVALVPLDLSFDAFYTPYAMKFNGHRAEKVWLKLSDQDRYDAIRAIGPYDRWLTHSKIAKKHPDTFLSMRAWKDDYTIKP